MPTSHDPSNAYAQDDARVAAILERRASGLIAADEALAELADADCGPAIAALVAGRVRLPAGVVLRALDAADDLAISVMCRAAGFSINGFSAVLRLRRRHRHGIGSAPHDALMFFSTLSRASAESIVRQIGALDPASRAASG